MFTYLKYHEMPTEISQDSAENQIVIIDTPSSHDPHRTHREALEHPRMSWGRNMSSRGWMDESGVG
ncbi:hypothetical protein BD779DRAFT_1533686 [Infundibulicybe gibba]|nr:hypothetical protein BD779DRAFT_1533686 [Infundibulicybe gibba]